MADLQTTRLNKPWLLKLLIFAIVLLFFGCYGLYDALVAYPNRGLRYASYMQYQYLDFAKKENRLDHRAGIADPVEELARLRKIDRPKLTDLEATRMDWLKALEIVGQLKPERTKIDDAPALFEQLKKDWTTSDGARSAPKPLAAYDIPVQWLYVVLGFGGGLWLLGLLANVSRTKYQWDADSQTLTLPDGNALTPADIEDFDKRKWDKYLVFLKVKPAHATLGGQEIKLDLYRHAPLEEWVLTMERTAFQERAQENDSAIAAAPAPAEPPPQ